MMKLGLTLIAPVPDWAGLDREDWAKACGISAQLSRAQLSLPCSTGDRAKRQLPTEHNLRRNRLRIIY